MRTFRILLLEEEKNRVLVFAKSIEAEWVPNSEATWRIAASTLSYNEVIITYGEDAEQQSRSVYIKLWTIDDGILNWAALSIFFLTKSHENHYFWEN
jgi:hypothetical protein